MGEDKSVEKKVSPAVQEALDLADKARALKTQIDASSAGYSNDVDVLIDKMLQYITQHTLDCRQLISQINETLAPGESSHYRRMKALDDLAQIDRLNEMLVLKVSQKISAGRYDGMGTLTLHHAKDNMGIDGVLSFPFTRLKMQVNKEQSINPINRDELNKHNFNVIKSALGLVENKSGELSYEQANPLLMNKPFFTKPEK